MQLLSWVSDYCVGGRGFKALPCQKKFDMEAFAHWHLSRENLKCGWTKFLENLNEEIILKYIKKLTKASLSWVQLRYPLKFQRPYYWFICLKDKNSFSCFFLFSRLRMCLSCGENGSLRSIDVVFHLPQMMHQTLSNSHSVVAAVQEQSYSLHFHLYIACNIVPEAVGMDRHPQPPLQSRKVL